MSYFNNFSIIILDTNFYKILHDNLNITVNFIHHAHSICLVFSQNFVNFYSTFSMQCLRMYIMYKSTREFCTTDRNYLDLLEMNLRNRLNLYSLKKKCLFIILGVCLLWQSSSISPTGAIKLYHNFRLDGGYTYMLYILHIIRILNVL